ncbi:MAG: DNA-processing protein DprA [bacterium]
MDTRSAIIALNMVPGIGSVKLNRLIGRFGSPEKVFEGKAQDLSQVVGIGPEIIRYITYFNDFYSVEKEIKECADKNIQIITVLDENYPQQIRNIYDPPPVLYCAGLYDKWPANALNIGIVGTRMATDYGERALKKILNEMKQTKLMFAVVSGMARGIDCIAHMESVKENIYTAAILGFGLNKIWPFEKHYIAQHIIKAGVIMSEFPLDMLPLKQNFPRRNRVISGLSDGVLVVEAGERSGALITADYALEQGREVFAIPGNIFADKSIGANNLIKQGAKSVMSIYDITEEFELLAKPKERNVQQEISLLKLDENEKKVYDVLSSEKKHIDNISIESNIEIIKLSSILTILEMKGIVTQMSGKTFVRKA